MESEWPLLSVESLTEKVAMGPFGSNIKVSTFVDSGVPVISGEHLHGTRMQDGRFNFITEEHAKKLKNSLVERGDVVFTHAGNIGQAAVIPNTSRYPKYIISQRQFYARCKRDLIIPEYLAYFFHSPEGRHKLLSNASQVGVPSIARPSSHLKSIEVPTPPLSYQKRVVEILEAVENRIDHNRAIAAKLEAIARRLFKSWFVDFDPVRAKAAGEKPPGLADDIAALFPDRFVDSELGEIPEGWGIASFSAFAELDTTSVKPFDHPEMQWTHFSIPSFDEGRFPATETGEQIASSKYQVRPGSVLVSKLNPTQWRCWRPPSELVSKHSICSTEFMQFVAPENQQESLWGKCESDPFREAVLATVDGTTGSRQRAKPKDVMRSTIVLPHSRLTAEYSSIVRPLLQRVDACVLEARSLSQLRDLLLPRLISGRLRVSEAEEAIAEAMM